MGAWMRSHLQAHRSKHTHKQAHKRKQVHMKESMHAHTHATTHTHTKAPPLSKTKIRTYASQPFVHFGHSSFHSSFLDESCADIHNLVGNGTARLVKHVFRRLVVHLHNPKESVFMHVISGAELLGSSCWMPRRWHQSEVSSFLDFNVLSTAQGYLRTSPEKNTVPQVKEEQNTRKKKIPSGPPPNKTTPTTTRWI